MARQTRDELDRRVAALRDQMPEILALEEKDQMEGFAGIAAQPGREVLVAAGPAAFAAAAMSSVTDFGKCCLTSSGMSTAMRCPGRAADSSPTSFSSGSCRVR